MDSRKIARIAVCALFLCLLLAFVIEYADAAPPGQKGHTPPVDEKSPTKTQMMLGVGSVIVAIIVIKWL